MHLKQANEVVLVGVESCLQLIIIMQNPQLNKVKWKKEEDEAITFVTTDDVEDSVALMR